MQLKDMIYLSDSIPIRKMEIGKLYYCDGIDGSANHTVFLRTTNFFVSGLAWDNGDGTLRLKEEREERQEHFCFALSYRSVKNLTTDVGYLVLAEFSVDGYSENITGRSDTHSYIEHFFYCEPGNYLLKIDPLLTILAASKKDMSSYIFSLITLDADGIDSDNIVADGFIHDSDDLGAVDGIYELVNETSNLETIQVTSHAYTIGGGESEDMPPALLEQIVYYGAEDFILLDCVDQLERCDFIVNAEDFR